MGRVCNGTYLYPLLHRHWLRGVPPGWLWKQGDRTQVGHGHPDTRVATALSEEATVALGSGLQVCKGDLSLQGGIEGIEGLKRSREAERNLPWKPYDNSVGHVFLCLTHTHGTDSWLETQCSQPRY